MRMGIRSKLVGTLVLAGLLPLVLSLVAGMVAVRAAARQSIGQSLRALARQQAEHVGTLLAAEVDFLWLMNQLPGTAEALDEASQRPPTPPAELESIEKRWPNLPPTDPLVQSILNHDLARRWQALQRQHPRIAELMITDATGRLVAATNITTDYFQGDEPWWQEAYANGRGKLILQDVTFDPSAISPGGAKGALVVNVVIPIHKPQSDATDRRPVVGVMKASIDARWLLGQLTQFSPADEMRPDVLLFTGDGQIVTGIEKPPFERVPASMLVPMREHSSGYLVTRALPNRSIVGYARVPFRQHQYAGMIDWRVLMTTVHAEALAETNYLLWTILLGGILFIALCFVGGYWIASREVIRPLRALTEGAAQVEAGNLNHRLRGPGDPGSIFRHDELGRLARDFNRMVIELQRNLAEAQRASAIKQQFIDLASHELRTPVTYILGISELAQRNNSPEKELFARVAQRAQRLNRIVENMFKLQQSGTYDSVLRPEQVDVEKAITTAVGELEPFAASRKLTFRVQLVETDPVVEADPEKLRDILNNLLSNAVRFSPDGSTIHVELIDREREVEIVISDQGPGIPPEDVPRLFEPFFTGTASLPHHQSGEYQYMTRGIGLGMSVVRRFVEMHGGTVRIEPTPSGTTARVILPKTLTP